MGSAVGLVLQANGHEVLWASEGRSEATRVAGRIVPRRRHRRRARGRGGADPLDLPAARGARRGTRAVEGFDGVYVDANAISPAHALEIAALHPRFVDGGIVGGPPREPGTTLYLSGAGAAAVAALFAGSVLETRVVANASALKMAYAAWSKGTTALLLAIRDVARHFDVEDDWRRRGARARRPAAARGARRRDEGLALDRRDGGDRRHVRGRRAAGRLPSGRRAGVPVVITARGLAKRYGDRRVFAGLDLDLAAAASCSSPARTARARRRSCGCWRGSRRRPPASCSLPGAPHASATSGHEPLVYRELSPLENLTLFGRLYRLPERGERVGMLLERFGLWDVRHERVSTFSRGMQQRLGLCRVLLHEPSLLLLDEPYNALDAQGAELLDGVLDEPRTWVVATHEPQRVERRATERLAFA